MTILILMMCSALKTTWIVERCIFLFLWEIVHVFACTLLADIRTVRN